MKPLSILLLALGLVGCGKDVVTAPATPAVCAASPTLGTWTSVDTAEAITIKADCSYVSTSGDVGGFKGAMGDESGEEGLEITASSDAGVLGVGLHECGYSHSAQGTTEQLRLICDRVIRNYVQ